MNALLPGAPMPAVLPVGAAHEGTASSGEDANRVATGPVLPIDLQAGLALDHAAARSVGEALASDYCFAEPFPHIVLDHFLPDDVGQLALDHFPRESLRS